MSHVQVSSVEASVNVTVLYFRIIKHKLTFNWMMFGCWLSGDGCLPRCYVSATSSRSSRCENCRVIDLRNEYRLHPFLLKTKRGFSDFYLFIYFVQHLCSLLPTWRRRTRKSPWNLFFFFYQHFTFNLNRQLKQAKRCDDEVMGNATRHTYIVGLSCQMKGQEDFDWATVVESATLWLSKY